MLAFHRRLHPTPMLWGLLLASAASANPAPPPDVYPPQSHGRKTDVEARGLDFKVPQIDNHHDFEGRRAGGMAAAVAGLVVAGAASARSPGREILKSGGANVEAAACVACHGADLKGVPDEGYPRLAGLPAKYVVKQLHDFRSGDRDSAIMRPIASAMNENEMAAVAQELSERAHVNVPAPASPPDPKPGTAEWLALRGDGSRNIPGCVLCHGPSGVGVGDYFPPLGGQSALYLRTQLLAFRERKESPDGKPAPATRGNDINHLMGHIAGSLTEPEISGLAEYFGKLEDSGEPSEETGRGMR